MWNLSCLKTEVSIRNCDCEICIHYFFYWIYLLKDGRYINHQHIWKLRTSFIFYMRSVYLHHVIWMTYEMKNIWRNWDSVGVVARSQWADTLIISSAIYGCLTSPLINSEWLWKKLSGNHSIIHTLKYVSEESFL